MSEGRRPASGSGPGSTPGKGSVGSVLAPAHRLAFRGRADRATLLGGLVAFALAAFLVVMAALQGERILRGLGAEAALIVWHGGLAVEGLFLCIVLSGLLARRLHDQDRTGWWLVPLFLPPLGLLLGPWFAHEVWPALRVMAGGDLIVRAPPPEWTPEMEAKALESGSGGGPIPFLPHASTAELLGFLSVALLVAIAVLLALPGTPGPNRHGDVPRD